MARATFRVAGGPESGQSFDVVGELEIGRGLPDSLNLGDPTISRHHARLDIDASGRLIIEDLGSHNGTRVNGRLTTGAEPLAVGDVIDLGDTTLEVTAIDVTDVSRADQPTKLNVARADQQTRISETPARDEEQERAAARSRTIAAGLPVLPVRSIITGVRIRAALALVAVVVLLWVVLYIRESNGDDPGLAKTTAAAPTGSTNTATSSTNATTSPTNTTTSSVSPTTSTVTTKTS